MPRDIGRDAVVISQERDRKLSFNNVIGNCSSNYMIQQFSREDPLCDCLIFEKIAPKSVLIQIETAIPPIFLSRNMLLQYIGNAQRREIYPLPAASSCAARFIKIEARMMDGKSILRLKTHEKTSVACQNLGSL